MEVQEYSCNCEYCQRLCSFRVGWPTPEEAVALIEYFKSQGYSLKEIFEKFLVIDYYFSDSEKGEIFIIAPRWTECGKELYAPFIPIMKYGSCVFKKKDRCILHGLTYNGIPLKPLECRVGGCKSGKKVYKVHREIAKMWKERQNIIEEIVKNVSV